MKSLKGGLHDFELQYEKLPKEGIKFFGVDRVGDRYFRIISTRPLRRVLRKNNKVRVKR